MLKPLKRNMPAGNKWHTHEPTLMAQTFAELFCSLLARLRKAATGATVLNYPRGRIVGSDLIFPNFSTLHQIIEEDWKQGLGPRALNSACPTPRREVFSSNGWNHVTFGHVSSRTSQLLAEPTILPGGYIYIYLSTFTQWEQG